ncbi:guanylate kinase [Clostridium pasteurianum DSM 525 = ATCC 6013]|uniref:Guanylate kinase n=1 Tax=Clostridium pasteurianum DSM 525 = ATCC 6013 TaxID=1262449 RepID=A0A0H3J0M4_CLOPA|nr:guanylate kinase [Clostridium pasteurianum]AJA46217.1 guanylate kinase [Clostridium pasteurianum DSM 525 = ATCC 6013]AJA50205.1 guanylate kinase [Clostridium pasteurianum DSM 525 = ATCC 6013]AOZ73673.1 guanylate kinase [Clostridium pasteurianum DSM 525 = ATCC 6013]AOZ77470.1 guanylate kinase [Clostridium pasteurianum]ELP60802.1 guanylate kinase [Clostridium pasteurianum DSM 525 = ATCC 6013]
MGKIFCLLGKSGSGKDTIFKRLIDKKVLNLKAIIPYTTRPKREKETNGIEYYFIDEDKLNNYKNMGKVIEIREYNTVNGIWYYSTIDDGQIDGNNNGYLIITTLEAYVSLQNYFGKDKVVPIYITLDDGIRLERALKREREQEKPNYSEMCRRFLADERDFSESKLKSAGIKKVYYNYEINECINDIKKSILSYY